MKAIEALGNSFTQAEFALIVGISEARVSQLVTDGALPQGGSVLDLLRAYVDRLREQAAGRLGAMIGGLDLSQERAALAREMRMGHEIRNAVARGEYAPVGLLADVLGLAASAVVDRIDQLEGALRKSCPDLPDEALQTVLTVIASARNEWIRATAKLAIDALEPQTPDDDVVAVADGSSADMEALVQ